jgi:Nickel responsive protein SCO4226-like
MPRYVVERTFPDGLEIPVDDSGAAICLTVVGRNADEGVTWVHSYVSDDKKKTFCVYDAPSPEAIRKTASKNALPVDTITQVSVLDPYFYR